MKAFVLGIDMESFGKSVLESGTDSSSRSLPIILELNRSKSVGDAEGYLHVDRTKLSEQVTTEGGNGVGAYVQGAIVSNPAATYIAVDTFVCSDAWFFWNSDGSVICSV